MYVLFSFYVPLLGGQYTDTATQLLTVHTVTVPVRLYNILASNQGALWDTCTWPILLCFASTQLFNDTPYTLDNIRKKPSFAEL